jgi:hypothetical protein
VSIVNEEIERRLEAEAVAESRGYVTDGQVRYILTAACAPLEIPFPWWTVDEEVTIQPQASVSELLDAAPTKDR